MDRGWRSTGGNNYKGTPQHDTLHRWLAERQNRDALIKYIIDTKGIPPTRVIRGNDKNGLYQIYKAIKNFEVKNEAYEDPIVNKFGVKTDQIDFHFLIKINYEVENVIRYTYTDGEVDEHKEIAEKIFHIIILGES